MYLQVTFGKVDVFYIPYTMRESGTTLSSKALFITSDHDIAVYALNKERFSSDAFLVLPIDVLGKEYYAGENVNYHYLDVSVGVVSGTNCTW